jgi:hypothetical protein
VGRLTTRGLDDESSVDLVRHERRRGAHGAVGARSEREEKHGSKGQADGGRANAFQSIGVHENSFHDERFPT